MPYQPGSTLGDMPRGDMRAVSDAMPRGGMSQARPAAGAGDMPIGSMHAALPVSAASTAATIAPGGDMPYGTMACGPGQGMPGGDMRPATDSSEGWNMDVVAAPLCGCR
jgi:hypothetical protein